MFCKNIWYKQDHPMCDHNKIQNLTMVVTQLNLFLTSKTVSSKCYHSILWAKIYYSFHISHSIFMSNYLFKPNDPEHFDCISNKVTPSRILCSLLSNSACYLLMSGQFLVSFFLYNWVPVCYAAFRREKSRHKRNSEE